MKTQVLLSCVKTIQITRTKEVDKLFPSTKYVISLHKARMHVT